MILVPTIDPEFRNLCPGLKPEELAGLRDSLQREGLKHPIEVWNGIILDGHNRFQLCQELGIEPREQPVADPAVTDRPSAINWIISNQLARRNLTPQEAMYLRGKRYETEKMAPVRPKSLKNGIKKAGQNDQLPSARGETQETLGKELGVAGITVRRAAAFARGVDRIAQTVSAKDAADVRSGTKKLTRDQVTKIGRAKTDQEAKKLYQEALKTKPKPKRRPLTPAQANKRMQERSAKNAMPKEEAALWLRWQAFANASDYMGMAAQGDVAEFARWARTKNEVWKWLDLNHSKLRWISDLMRALMEPRT